MNSQANEVVINQRLTVPESELSFRFSGSGGPGGQHVNKRATQVTLLFDVAGSPSLDEESRRRLLLKLASRLDKDGVLQITVQDTRSQHQNRDIAVGRFQALLAEALRRPKFRRKTRPSRAARERRLTDKKRRGEMKKSRRWRWKE
jgi:ribosome-associated protein